MKRVMIVDDNHLSVESIYRNIDWEGLDAQVIERQYDSYAAIAALDRTAVDLIISDIEMPGLSGLELAVEFTRINPLVKIILISAYSKFDYAKQAVRIGVFDYIEKPINFQYLTKKIKHVFQIIDREKKTLSLLEASRPAMVENFFAELIHSCGDEAKCNLSYYLDYLNLQLNCQFYTVIILNIENADTVKTESGVRDYLMQLIQLQNNLTDLCHNLDLFHSINDLHGLITILGYNSPSQTIFQKKLSKIATALKEEYDENQLKINIGIGRIITQLWDMNQSYESSKQALEYRFFFPQQIIFDARDLGSDKRPVNLFAGSKEEQLIQLICKKDIIAISNWISGFSRELTDNIKTKNLLFIRIHSLLGHILKFLVEMNIDTEEIEIEIAGVYSRLEFVYSSEEIFKWLNRVCQMVCRKLDQSVQNYHGHICELVQQFIKSNYENSELCLNEIAEAINLSPAYLSALYKKCTGQNISEMITTVRIDAACHLLLHTELPLKEISVKIGYANQYYFSSCFKKKKGKNPSAYREERFQR